VAHFPDALRNLVFVYRESQLLSNASAVDPSMGGYGTSIDRGSGGHGKHGTTTTVPSFGAEAPLPVRMGLWLERAVAIWRYEMERERDGVERATLPPELVEMAAALNGIASSTPHARSGSRPSTARRSEDRQILEMTGDAIVVGLLFGRSSEAIRKLRDRAGKDPHTGERAVKAAPLTSRDSS
jgi:hypothetical protein